MSAEILRQAASLMRARAQAATQGPRETEMRMTYTTVWAGGARIADTLTHADATHIASWDPTVALAVAESWEVLADAINLGWLSVERNPARSAIRAARAYLGESA